MKLSRRQTDVLVLICTQSVDVENYNGADLARARFLTRDGFKINARTVRSLVSHELIEVADGPDDGFILTPSVVGLALVRLWFSAQQEHDRRNRRIAA
jgi:hypothetical protein